MSRADIVIAGSRTRNWFITSLMVNWCNGAMVMVQMFIPTRSIANTATPYNQIHLIFNINNYRTRVLGDYGECKLTPT